MLKMSAMRCMHWVMFMLRSVFGRWICCDGQVRVRFRGLATNAPAQQDEEYLRSVEQVWRDLPADRQG